MRAEKRCLDEIEMCEEAQRRLLGDVHGCVLPVLAAFDQQCTARIVGIVEEGVIAQAPPRGVAGVDDDVLRRADGAVVQSLTIGGASQPIRQDKRKLMLNVSPGAQQIEVSWRQPDAIALRYVAPDVDLGTPSDALRRALAENDTIATLIAAEPAAAALDGAYPRVAADEEALPFADGSLDLVVSALALQWVNDLPGALIQIRRALKPDGLLLAAMLGGDSLMELREAFASAESEMEGGLSPRVAPFADLRELGALMQRAGFALPVVDSDRLTVR